MTVARVAICVAIALATACDDGARRPGTDAEPPTDAYRAADVELDAMSPADAVPADAVPADAVPVDDGEPIRDASIDALPAPDAMWDWAPIDLPIDEAAIVGGGFAIDAPPGRESAAGRVLDADGALTWADRADAWTGPAALYVKAAAWRVEDGRITVQIGDGTYEGELAAHADGGWFVFRTSWLDGGGDGYGADWRPPPVRIEPPSAPWSLSLSAAEGGLAIYGARLAPPSAEAPVWVASRVDPAVGAPVVSVAPCGDASTCDDAANIREAIGSAPPGPVEIELAAGQYVLRTAVVIERDDVALVGQGMEATTLLWDPDGAARAAIAFQGAGSGEEWPLSAPFEAGARRFEVPEGGEAFEAMPYVWLTADDYGEIPALCRGGRDVERYNRHIAHLARRIGGDGATVEMDRALHLDLRCPPSTRLMPHQSIATTIAPICWAKRRTNGLSSSSRPPKNPCPN